MTLQIQRAFSSAGTEQLPYKQQVGGSTPSTPILCEHGGMADAQGLGSCGRNSVPVQVRLLAPNAVVAQLVELLLPEQVVVGSSPVYRTKLRLTC
jgi:hypothetical protein